MSKNSNGFGMVGLLIALAVICALMCFYLQQRNQSLRQAMAKQHVEIPTDVDVNNPADVEKFVTQSVESANESKERSLDCATDPESCRKPANQHTQKNDEP